MNGYLFASFVIGLISLISLNYSEVERMELENEDKETIGFCVFINIIFILFYCLWFWWGING